MCILSITDILFVLKNSILLRVAHTYTDIYLHFIQNVYKSKVMFLKLALIKIKSQLKVVYKKSQTPTIT